MGGNRLEPRDVRALLQLGHELHELPADPARRRKHLLDSLCRLVGADFAQGVVAHVNPATGRHDLLSAVQAGDPSKADGPSVAGNPIPELTLFTRRAAAVARKQAAVEAAKRWRSIPAFGDGRRIEHCIISPNLGAGDFVLAGVALHRAAGTRRGFLPRHRLLVGLIHGEMGWLYQPDLALVSPAVLALTHRQQQTLHSLLAGHGEKQIAREMNLSPHTIHHYVKVLYKHFHVTSRSELLARWVHE